MLNRIKHYKNGNDGQHYNMRKKKSYKRSKKRGPVVSKKVTIDGIKFASQV
jgi:hypothetical protein